SRAGRRVRLPAQPARGPGVPRGRPRLPPPRLRRPRRPAGGGRQRRDPLRARRRGPRRRPRSGPQPALPGVVHAGARARPRAPGLDAAPERDRGRYLQVRPLGRARRAVAYVVGQGGEAPEGGELRGYLEERLPRYMVPAVYVEMERLPQTPNGKV